MASASGSLDPESSARPRHVKHRQINSFHSECTFLFGEPLRISKDSPPAVLTSRYNYNGPGFSASFSAGTPSCTGAAGCACISGSPGIACRASTASRSGVSGRAGAASSSGAAGRPRISGATSRSGISGRALRPGRTCRQGKTTGQCKRRQYCGKLCQVFHDDFLFLTNQNYAHDCEQPSRFDQSLATMMCTGRSGHRYCTTAAAANCQLGPEAASSRNATIADQVIQETSRGLCVGVPRLLAAIELSPERACQIDYSWPILPKRRSIYCGMLSGVTTTTDDESPMADTGSILWKCMIWWQAFLRSCRRS
ncbi:MAG: hypothetical protein JWQ61_3798 [Collimonas fungivorans]|nr:hypothetical protein [Collimonas fungivorans]